MNRLLTIILLTFVSLAMSAENIGRRSAKQKAVTVMGAEAQLELAAVAEGSSPAYYVFNNTASAKGFVIVAGDEGNNDILGYATSGKFDADSLPPQLAFWLACYEEQLELIRQGGAAPYRSATIYPTIEPLVTTHWDQQSPYNKMNPKNPITNNQFPTTGCVATAMAQVMKYWSSDKATTDIPEYSYKLNSSGTIYTVNVSGLPATTINYSLLRNDYNSGDNDASAQEVARLMAYCGRAAKMAYMSTTASAVSIVLRSSVIAFVYSSSFMICILCVRAPDVDALVGCEVHGVALDHTELVVDWFEHLRVHVNAQVVQRMGV